MSPQGIAGNNNLLRQSSLLDNNISKNLSPVKYRFVFIPGASAPPPPYSPDPPGFKTEYTQGNCIILKGYVCIEGYARNVVGIG